MTSHLFPTSNRVVPTGGRTGSMTRATILVVCGVLALTVSAKIQVPLWPVKFSMQTFVVLLIATAYGSRLGASTVAAYLGVGALGLPVFSSGGGLGLLAGPTAGYLLGFIPAVVFVGALSERGWSRSLPRTACALLLGDLIILSLGTSWLSMLVGPERAFNSGFLLFVPAESLKIGLALALIQLTASRR